MRNLSDRVLGKTYISQLMRAVGAPAAVLLALAALVPAASAKTATMHLFSRETSATFVTPQGRPLPRNTRPTVGDVNDITGVDYVGNHKHHAKRWTATGHLACTFTSITGPMNGTATCDAQIAIGGSMLLVENAKLTFSSSPTVVVALTGGTGKFRGAHGHAKSTSIGNTNNSDLTITYSG